MKKIYIWLIFTVLIGLLPIIARITAVNIFMLKDVVTISPVDIIVFGIVLHVSILNELNNFQKDLSFVTHSNFIIIISLQLDGVTLNRSYFKLRVSDKTEFIV